MRASRFLNGWQLYGDDYWNAIRVGLHQMKKSLTIDIYSSGCRQRFSFFYSFLLGYFSFPFIHGANVIITRTYIIILFPRSFYDFRLPSVYPTFFLSLSLFLDGYNFRRCLYTLLAAVVGKKKTTLHFHSACFDSAS